MNLINIFKAKKNKECFEEKLSLIYKDLYTLIYSITKNQHLTDDILQETLMKAYKKFDTIKDINKFKSWMFIIAKNESLSWIKKYNREIPIEDIHSEPLESSSENIPEELLIKNETKEQVKESIKVLRLIDQEIIYLKYYHDLTLDEIALILNMNENTVRTRHIRTKKKIYNHIICTQTSLEIASTTLEKTR